MIAPEIANLTPAVVGAEVYTVDARLGVKAFAGTGFNPDNEQHTSGSDVVRYAIALQQLRDAGDFAALDAARSTVERFGNFVMQDRDGTRVKPQPVGWSRLSVSQKKISRLDGYTCPVIDGVLYDV